MTHPTGRVLAALPVSIGVAADRSASTGPAQVPPRWARAAIGGVLSAQRSLLRVKVMMYALSAFRSAVLLLSLVATLLASVRVQAAPPTPRCIGNCNRKGSISASASPPGKVPTKRRGPKPTPTITPTATGTPPPTAPPTQPPSPTPSATSTASPSHTPTFSPTRTPTRSFSPTATPTTTPTRTAGNTVTATGTATPSATPTRTLTATATATRTVTATPSATPRATATVTPTGTPTRSSTPTNTPTPSPTPTRSVAPPPCEPRGSLPGALLECRNFIMFQPGEPFDPTRGIFPSESELRAMLQQLYDEGWRGLGMWSMDGSLSLVPRLAKEIGFSTVIAGVYFYDEAQLAREKAAVLAQRPYIDGLFVGSEGLHAGRYSRQRLEVEMAWFRVNTGLPVSTSEPDYMYLQDPTLLTLGDWVSPNIHSWFAGFRSPGDGAAWVQSRYQTLQTMAPGRLVVIRESWWPVCSDPAASEINQREFFAALSERPVTFLWGESHSQFWKTAEPNGVGVCWGLHSSSGVPHQVIFDLEAVFTGAY